MSTTVVQAVVEIARLSGFLKNRGHATATTSLTLTDAQHETTATAAASQIYGNYLLITSGMAVGQFRKVSSYAIGVFTWIGPLGMDAPDWALLSVSPPDILDAMLNVTTNFRRTQGLTYRSTALCAGSLLDYMGDFEEWNAANTIPTGASTPANSTWARVDSTNANPPRHGNYSGQGTDSGSGGGYLPFFVDPARHPAL